MSFTMLRYLIKEGYRSLRKNMFMTAASVLVLVSCLLLTGCTFLVFENINVMCDELYKQNIAIASADFGTTQEQNEKIEQEIKALDNVDSVEFQSKDELLERYKDEFAGVFDDLKEDNPLQDVFIVRFKNLEDFKTTLNQIKRIDHVESVEYDAGLSQTLVDTRNIIVAIGICVVVLLLLVSVFIISNTIKLTVFTRRLEIYIMRSVGATSWFIRFPFMIEGLLLGFAAGALAYGLVYGLYVTVQYFFPINILGFQLIAFKEIWWQLLVGFLPGGMVVGMLGSTLSTGKHLKEHVE